jgi:hypothetical protein
VRRRTRVLVGVAALLAVALVVATGVALWPQIQAKRARAERRAKLDALLLRKPDAKFRDGLLPFTDDPDAVLPILDPFVLHNEEPLARHAVQLYATTPEPHDERIGARLRALAADTTLKLESRFEALYLLDELETPTFPPEPEHFAGDLPVSGKSAAVLDELRRRGVKIEEPAESEDTVEFSDRNPEVYDFENLTAERPYRALVRIAQERNCLLRVESGAWQLLPRLDYSWRRGGRSLGAAARAGVSFSLTIQGEDLFLLPPFDEGLTPIRVFRALAALNGWELHRSTDDPDTWVVSPSASHAREMPR